MRYTASPLPGSTSQVVLVLRIHIRIQPPIDVRTALNEQVNCQC
jgi:hypothetical protein